jgi:hypothetical protein
MFKLACRILSDVAWNLGMEVTSVKLLIMSLDSDVFKPVINELMVIDETKVAYHEPIFIDASRTTGHIDGVVIPRNEYDVN